MMTLRGIAATYRTYYATNIRTPALPATPPDGDTLLVAVIANEDRATISGPEGWVLVETSPQRDPYTSTSTVKCRVHVFAKLAEDEESADPNGYLFTSDIACGLNLVFADYEGSSEVHVYNSSAHSRYTGAERSLPKITTTEGEATVVYFIGTCLSSLQTDDSASVQSVTAGTLRLSEAGWYLNHAVSDLSALDPGIISNVEYKLKSSAAYGAEVAIALVPVETPTSVRVSPHLAVVVQGGTKQFTATVFGAENEDVIWSVVEAGGGEIDAYGLYTAPDTIGTYTIRATSVEDPESYGEATVRVVASGSGTVVVLHGTLWYREEGA
jgi:hypothetical protein